MPCWAAKRRPLYASEVSSTPRGGSGASENEVCFVALPPAARSYGATPEAAQSGTSGGRCATGNDELTVSVKVTNTGRRAGKEVTLVFVSDLVASLSPPGRRLKRFSKVYLEPGQSRTLTFTLRHDDLSFIGAANKPVVEPGDFEILVGGLTDKFTLK